jgi:hypothetical protein
MVATMLWLVVYITNLFYVSGICWGMAAALYTNQRKDCIKYKQHRQAWPVICIKRLKEAACWIWDLSL